MRPLWKKYKLKIDPLDPDYKIIAVNHDLVCDYLERHPEAADNFRHEEITYVEALIMAMDDDMVRLRHRSPVRPVFAVTA